MTDLVAEYVVLEREILTHRLRVLLAGLLLPDVDPEEDRFEAAFDRLWMAMSAEQRSSLDHACDRRTSAWLEPAVGRDAPSPDVCAYVVWLRALVDAVEVSLPRSTRARVGSSPARSGRLLVAWNDVRQVPGAARAAVVDAALLLLGRTLDETRDAGGLRFVDPDTAEVLLAADVAPSGVSEPPAPPFA